MSRVHKQFGSVEYLEAAFYDAIGRADLDSLMTLWADEAEIVCIHPNGMRLIGHAAIRSSWESMFMHGGISIRPVQLSTLQTTTSAVHNLIEDISTPEAIKRDIHVVATNVYINTSQGWRMVMHHASVAPGRYTMKRMSSAILH